MKGHEPQNIICVGESSYAKFYGAIIVHGNDAIWSFERCLIFIFCSLFKYDLLSLFITVRGALGILALVVDVYQMLFLGGNKFPICNVFNIEDHVLAKDQLTG